MITIVFILVGLAVVLFWVITDPRVRKTFYTGLMGKSEAEAFEVVTRPGYLALLWAARVWVTSAYLAMIVVQFTGSIKVLYPIVFWLNLALGAASWIPLYSWFKRKS